ncbi:MULTISPECIES: hypothetical protein [Bradyrhizobium]|jgi:hypothetical protein|uniref:hypothetical protein n=1 Tax=Bradyrhizobium TaxID=374 RepID=UPI00293E4D64|nr:hypothetical protein [Bradyrhizobium sp. NDS-1]WOH75117.1 hypothetical protein RX330_08335 [Bradyrhizobium sp. NDS-1]
MGRKISFIQDQGGAVSFELPIVLLFMLITILFPLADVAIAGFKYLSAHQALRDMGQFTQYKPPSDVTSSSAVNDWKSSLPSSVGGYSITAEVYCDGTPAPCASGATLPKYYTFTTSFSLSPMVLSSMLCSTCTVKYSERFQ